MKQKQIDWGSYRSIFILSRIQRDKFRKMFLHLFNSYFRFSNKVVKEISGILTSFL